MMIAILIKKRSLSLGPDSSMPLSGINHKVVSVATRRTRDWAIHTRDRESIVAV